MSSLFLSKILEHPEYKTADPNEKKFFRSKTKEVTERLPQMKQALLTRFKLEHDAYLKKQVCLVALSR